MQRPKSITIIAWVLIVISVLSLITTTVNLNNPRIIETMEQSPLPIVVQHVLSYLSVIISLICGIAFLKGQNWARFLYVISQGASVIIGLLTAPVKLAIIPHLVVLVIISFFLFRTPANKYFKGEETDDTDRESAADNETSAEEGSEPAAE